tara:strand:- start:1583 stop:1879 length:297 start_codon:yes stop_codon:yes gene_type:complete
MLKTITTIFFLLLLNGCVQSTAFLGPAITGASTGSVYQAGLSFGTSHVVSKVTGKTPTENIKFFLLDDSEKEKMNAKNFFNLVKKINKNSGVKTLSNQ